MAILSSEYFILFLIISIGILLGKVKIFGITLDSSAVIFVALFFGHFGYSIPPIFQQIGLIFFIYSIGVQAGPGFFESFQKKGFQLIMIAAIVVVSGSAMAVVAAYSFNIDFKLAVGLFTGALTSTPGLAAAIESSNSPLASIGYGIAYPFGVIGVILFVRLVPKVLKFDIKKAEVDFEQDVAQDYPEIITKKFIVENDNIVNKSIGELEVRSMTGGNISRIVHNGEAVAPDVDSVLHKGDLVKVVGTAPALKKVGLLIGRETKKEVPQSGQFDVQWILVTNKKVVRKTLGELNLFNNYTATVTRIRRSGIDITPTVGSQIRFGDKLMVASSKGNMPAVIELFGNNVKMLNEADFLPISAGIVIGVLLGIVDIPIPGGGVFNLGLSGGVLISGLILSRIGKTGPIIWNVSGPSNQLLRQIGLLFFLAAVGTQAGETLVETVKVNGLVLVLTAIILTILPMLISALIGIYGFKVNVLSVFGTLVGGMTSTPGLSAVDSLTDSNAPSIAYATVYPFALVIMIICAQILGAL
jgi:putative transport protein